MFQNHMHTWLDARGPVQDSRTTSCTWCTTDRRLEGRRPFIDLCFVVVALIGTRIKIVYQYLTHSLYVLVEQISCSMP